MRYTMTNKDKIRDGSIATLAGLGIAIPSYYLGKYFPSIAGPTQKVALTGAAMAGAGAIYTGMKIKNALKPQRWQNVSRRGRLEDRVSRPSWNTFAKAAGIAGAGAVARYFLHEGNMDTSYWNCGNENLAHLVESIAFYGGTLGTIATGIKAALSRE